MRPGRSPRGGRCHWDQLATPPWFRVESLPVIAFLIGACLFASEPSAAVALPPRPSYVALLGRYHRGERYGAMRALAQWSNGDLEKQFDAMRTLVLAAEHCETLPAELRALACPNQLGLPLPTALRVAVMLHAETDFAKRPSREGVEQPRSCPGTLSDFAGRYAALLARSSATRDFARRFFLMMALRTQWDACFDDAERWGRRGLEVFPGDAELLLCVGSVLEERATLNLSLATGAGGAAPGHDLGEAQRNLAAAISSDPGLVLARVRLGRVLWRRGQMALAQDALKEAVSRASDPGQAYLAHLFLGQAYEDSNDLGHARDEYRTATELDPEAQSAALALSRALQLLGEGEESLRVLQHGLEGAGRRSRRDPYWEYLVANALGFRDLVETLGQEALR